MINRIKSFLLEYLVLIAIIVLVIVTTAIEPKFLSGSNLENIMRQFGPLSFVSLGMTFVIIAGYIDLSVGGIISLVAVVTVTLIDPVGQTGALMGGILLGLLMGLFNGVLLLAGGANTGVKALFITFGLGSFYEALALMITGGSTIHMGWVTKPWTIFKLYGSGSVGFLSISFIVFLVCISLLYLFQSKTYLGRAILLTGGNRVAGELSGVPVNLALVLVYCLSGVLTSLGAILLLSRTTTAIATLGVGYETNAILAVVIGGTSLRIGETSLRGSTGSVLRTVLGIVLVTLMSNCLNLLGVSTYMQSVFKGAILVLAVWLDNLKEKW